MELSRTSRTAAPELPRLSPRLQLPRGWNDEDDNKTPPQGRERAVPMVLVHRHQQGTQWAAISSMAGQTGQQNLSGTICTSRRPSDRTHGSESACPRFSPRPEPKRPTHLLPLQVDARLFDKFVGQPLGEQSPIRRGAARRVAAGTKVFGMRREQRIRAPLDIGTVARPWLLVRLGHTSRANRMLRCNDCR